MAVSIIDGGNRGINLGKKPTNLAQYTDKLCHRKMYQIHLPIRGKSKVVDGRYRRCPLDGHRL
jgi:hypothetical protein